MLDTHVWFWWAVVPSKLSRHARRAVEGADRIGIPALAILELAELVERRRIELDTPTRLWARAALAQERVEVLPLTPDVAVDAAQLSFVRDPFDRVIYATARAEGAQLVTRDEQLRAFDPELTVW